MMSLSTSLAVLALLAGINASPLQQQPLLIPQTPQFNPLKHLSAISPWFIPSHEPTPLPPHCTIKRASVLIRHSSILGNDDEFEDTMSPFIEKIKGMDVGDLPEGGEWGWLRDWECPIVEENLEVLSGRGKGDAKKLGKYLRDQYEPLFPPKKRTSTDLLKKKKGKKHSTYKVWTASSPRDIDSAKSYILGSFPKHQAGDDGNGDGDVVQLVKVPNKAKDWDRSLTPHKACDAFEKISSLKPANEWLGVYAPKIKERLNGQLGKVELSDQDVLAMQMLCGYETIAVGSSHFCSLFTEDEWYDFEYYMDVRFHHMMGYGNTLSPYLGMPWVKTAKHLLAGKDGRGKLPHQGEGGMIGDEEVEVWNGREFAKLPKPELPPNATHTQLLHPSFTHRESPAFVSVFLNLYNDTALPYPSFLDPSTSERAPQIRQWRTSHITPFLGHVALERFTAEKGKHKGDYVRAVVNGKMEVMSGCEDGIERSCKWETFHDWVNERSERYGDWESVCEKE